MPLRDQVHVHLSGRPGHAIPDVHRRYIRLGNHAALRIDEADDAGRIAALSGAAKLRKATRIHQYLDAVAAVRRAELAVERSGYRSQAHTPILIERKAMAVATVSVPLDFSAVLVRLDARPIIYDY